MPKALVPAAIQTGEAATDVPPLPIRPVRQSQWLLGFFHPHEPKTQVQSR
jgi:hypothetical protein